MKKLVSTVDEKRFLKYGVSFPDDWKVTFVAEPYTDEQLIDACKKADYLFVGSVHRVSERVLRACPHLRMVHVEGVGFDKVDVDAARELGIPVCNNRAVNNTSVAEHTVGLILAAMRRTAYANAAILRDGYAACLATVRGAGVCELAGKRVGLIGIGAIGKEVTKRLIGWDCDVCYFDAFRPTAEVEAALHVTYLELDELIRTSDVISLHVPVLDSTRYMINAARLAEMKPGATLINTARGEIIDQDALTDALEAGTIAAAALDTVYPEPAPADHPLLNLSPQAQQRLTLTPHVGGTTNEAFTRMLKNAVENFCRRENGETPVNVVNGVR